MKASTTISLDRGLLAKARRVAKSQRRSFSAQLETWIAEKIAARPDPGASAPSSPPPPPSPLSSPPPDPDPSADRDLRNRRVTRAKDLVPGKDVA